MGELFLGGKQVNYSLRYEGGNIPIRNTFEKRELPVSNHLRWLFLAMAKSFLAETVQFSIWFAA
jgi:hypothetical protein